MDNKLTLPNMLPEFSMGYSVVDYGTEKVLLMYPHVPGLASFEFEGTTIQAKTGGCKVFFRDLPDRVINAVKNSGLLLVGVDSLSRPIAEHTLVAA